MLQVREVPDPEPGPGQVRVRMILSPVNPSDLLVVGAVMESCPRCRRHPASRESASSTKSGRGCWADLVQGKAGRGHQLEGGNWAEYAVIPARQARPVPDDIPDEQAASYFVNPATVLAMARHVLAVPKGEWLLQSAAGSTLGRMMINLGRHDGFKT